MMKLLLLVALGVVLYYVLRAPRVRSSGGPAAPRDGDAPALPQAMVRCPVCSVHLPRSDALPGASGRLYCCHEHRVQGGN
jgi:uncharacterized protein